MKKLLPLILLLVGAGGGVGAGVFLRPAPEPLTEEQIAQTKETVEAAVKEAEEAQQEFVKMSNQFVVPVVNNNRVQSLVVITLSVGVPVGNKDIIFTQEPKLRDAFLQVLFDHANMGGFDGVFTSAENMSALRQALLETAHSSVDESILAVQILDAARQDY